jgi:hypothetical protein
MALLIKSGTLVTAGDTFQADILIEGETIRLIGQDLAASGAQVIDAPASWCCRAAWTRTPISTCPCLAPFLPMITIPGIKPPLLAAPPP